MMDPVNIVLAVAFVAACILAYWLTMQMPLERGDPFAEAYGDQPLMPSGSLERDRP
jgi:hypothetical protein